MYEVVFAPEFVEWLDSLEQAELEDVLAERLYQQYLDSQ